MPRGAFERYMHACARACILCMLLASMCAYTRLGASLDPRVRRGAFERSPTAFRVRSSSGHLPNTSTTRLASMFSGTVSHVPRHLLRHPPDLLADRAHRHPLRSHRHHLTSHALRRHPHHHHHPLRHLRHPRSPRFSLTATCTVGATCTWTCAHTHACMRMCLRGARWE